MIKIFGPENRQQYISVSPDGNVFTPTEGTPLLANATTLNEAIRAYENEHAISIEPYDGSFEAIPFNEGENPKYFFYRKSPSDQQLVDIHVLRNGQEICPKQNLSFNLLDGDTVQIGELVC